MLEVKDLIWDDWNSLHIAKHKLTRAEIETACTGKAVTFAGKKGRLILLGLTQSRKLIAVILDPEPQTGIYYPVTARPASKKERRYYRVKKGGYDKAA